MGWISITKLVMIFFTVFEGKIPGSPREKYRRYHRTNNLDIKDKDRYNNQSFTGGRQSHSIDASTFKVSSYNYICYIFLTCSEKTLFKSSVAKTAQHYWFLYFSSLLCKVLRLKPKIFEASVLLLSTELSV